MEINCKECDVPMDQDEYVVIEHSCPDCLLKVITNEAGVKQKNYKEAWRELEKWIIEQDKWQQENNLVYWLPVIQRKMEETIDER